MKLKYELSFEEIDSETVAVPVNAADDFRGVLHMNGITSDIIKILENNVTEDEIVSVLKKSYAATEEQLYLSVRKIIGILRENGLLEE